MLTSNDEIFKLFSLFLLQILYYRHYYIYIQEKDGSPRFDTMYRIPNPKSLELTLKFLLHISRPSIRHNPCHGKNIFQPIYTSE